MSKIAVRFACWLLKLPLSLENRTRLTCAILEGLDAVPLSEIITRDVNGNLMIGGEYPEQDTINKLYESARGILNNPARKLVREHVRGLAGTRGVAQGDTPEKLYFYRAALWYSDTEQQMLEELIRK